MIYRRKMITDTRQFHVIHALALRFLFGAFDTTSDTSWDLLNTFAGYITLIILVGQRVQRRKFKGSR